MDAFSFAGRGLLATVAILALVFAPTGCGKPPASNGSAHSHTHGDDGHGHASVESFAAAVGELQELNAKVKEAFAAGSPADADDAVHRFGDILEALPDLAESDGVENATTVSPNCEALFDAYEKLDATIHGGEGEGTANYVDVADAIETALAELVAQAPETASHDHDGEGHEGHDHDAEEHEGEEHEGHDHDGEEHAHE